MSGYYPDGVSGNESIFRGSDDEYDADRVVYCINSECDVFDEAQDLLVTDIARSGSTEWLIYTCPTCNVQQESEREIDPWADWTD